ncbi:uncharacterized protein LOC113304433 [Papaver somniferum]|uniref:uncharacterized protein LOC113304433 n=1 Tax=Papaver somniferum TaxID=3469 RepID=UPI000E6F753B|nr:uncharacterized protein LOC113304433 [Papaver somniferum]XP_026409322.1 uncharacterized protein LOC113304433 [Papaver somniferum]XP_026409325.1 uncharacterized protein LOC113304433 [Papaver somniferum]XP_026409326.1 uncharacterized protein LOC113304433 [Papaver somniferum]XP_026409327.1 uncharacterized protein LOC113304433 [Papaver somniferum]XP_026409328.1 uncharacterized protein LOC113304433 [Papaver somniferum]XP_026409329.1 uncharacterized protein LOC113304433 [Papaver somniferum]XP_0
MAKGLSEGFQMILVAGTHLRNVNLWMERFKEGSSGIYLILYGKTMEKLMMAARFIENPPDVFIQSTRPYGQTTVMRFASYISAHPIAGRHTQETFTNRMQKPFTEPHITDTRIDCQLIKVAALKSHLTDETGSLAIDLLGITVARLKRDSLLYSGEDFGISTKMLTVSEAGIDVLILRVLMCTEVKLEGITYRLAGVQNSMKSLMSRGTILIGHNLNCDLRVLVLDHTRVIDIPLVLICTNGSTYGATGRKLSSCHVCKNVLGPDLRGKRVSEASDLHIKQRECFVDVQKVRDPSNPMIVILNWSKYFCDLLEVKEIHHGVPNQDYEIPREPPWVIRVSFHKINQSFAGTLRLTGLSTTADSWNEISLSNTINTSLSCLPKLVCVVWITRYYMESWQYWYTKCAWEQVLCEANTESWSFIEIVDDDDRTFSSQAIRLLLQHTAQVFGLKVVDALKIKNRTPRLIIQEVANYLATTHTGASTVSKDLDYYHNQFVCMNGVADTKMNGWEYDDVTVEFWMVHFSPFSVDFKNVMCHKDTKLIILKSHSALFHVLIKDGDYLTTVIEKHYKPKEIFEFLTHSLSWSEYLCEELEIKENPTLPTHVRTTKWGPCELLDPHYKEGIKRRKDRRFGKAASKFQLFTRKFSEAGSEKYLIANDFRRRFRPYDPGKRVCPSTTGSRYPIDDRLRRRFRPYDPGKNACFSISNSWSSSFQEGGPDVGHPTHKFSISYYKDFLLLDLVYFSI